MGKGKIYLMLLLCLNYLNCNLQDRKKKNSSNKKKKFDSVIRNPIGKKQQQLSVKKEKNMDKGEDYQTNEPVMFRGIEFLERDPALLGIGPSGQAPILGNAP